MSIIRRRFSRIVVTSVMALSTLSMAGVADAAAKGDTAPKPQCCVQSGDSGTEGYSAQWG